MEINGIIGELLLKNNCVVIPSFGGFVAKTASAIVDFDNGKMTPPKKVLTFNSQLVNNDGLLATFYAEKNKVSYDVALQSLNQFVSESKGALNNGSRVHFQNVGYLYYNEAGAIAFEQDRFFNLLLGAYGMGDIHFIPEQKEAAIPEEKVVVSPEEKSAPVKPLTIAHNTEKQESKKTEKVETPVVEITKKPVYKRIAKYAAAAALLPVLFYSFWIPMNTDVLQSKVLYTSDFNPFSETPSAVYSKNTDNNISADEVQLENDLKNIVETLPETAPVFSYPLTEDVYMIVKNPAVADKTVVTSVNSAPSSVPTSAKKEAGYHLIAGCFSNKENAEGLIEEMKAKGYEAFIVDFHKGLHRVSILQENNRSAVKKIHRKLKEQGTSTWILKR